ncbi:MAG: histone deacetylase family protein [Tibeticola sp.]
MVTKTGYNAPEACALHEMGDGHPENPRRLAAIEERLRASGLWYALQHRTAAPVSLADLELAHDRMYLASLRGLADELREQIAAGGPDHLHLDPDTALNLYTWDAALEASGAAIAATDAVLAGELDNAFCALRPPGHHAGPAKAMGFCFVNHVAVAARHALERGGLSRVAIVDFDVHHGNGTEEIVAGDARILMTSFYQHPFYPEGGARFDAPNLVNVPVPAGTRGMEIREIVEALWMPRLEAHRPQMIFISAGFDAHREDELGQLGLVEADYEWITWRLRALAQRHAGGRIVSCLEGGYTPGALARSVEAHLRALMAD